LGIVFEEIVWCSGYQLSLNMNFDEIEINLMDFDE